MSNSLFAALLAQSPGAPVPSQKWSVEHTTVGALPDIAPNNRYAINLEQWEEYRAERKKSTNPAILIKTRGGIAGALIERSDRKYHLLLGETTPAFTLKPVQSGLELLVPGPFGMPEETKLPLLTYDEVYLRQTAHTPPASLRGMAHPHLFISAPNDNLTIKLSEPGFHGRSTEIFMEEGAVRTVVAGERRPNVILNINSAGKNGTANEIVYPLQRAIKAEEPGSPPGFRDESGHEFIEIGFYPGSNHMTTGFRQNLDSYNVKMTFTDPKLPSTTIDLYTGANNPATPGLFPLHIRSQAKQHMKRAKPLQPAKAAVSLP